MFTKRGCVVDREGEHVYDGSPSGGGGKGGFLKRVSWTTVGLSCVSALIVAAAIEWLFFRQAVQSTTRTSVSVQVHADSTGEEERLDLSQVGDAQARQALEFVQEKLAAIFEYSYRQHVSMVYFLGEQRNELRYRETCSFQRPDRFVGKVSELSHTAPGVSGCIVHNCMDGQFFWHCLQQAPGSGQKRFGEAGDLSRWAKRLWIREYERPRVYQSDLRRLQEVGISPCDVVQQLGKLIRPFDLCDLASLVIAEEDEDRWVFAATPNRPLDNTGRILVQVGKADGIVQRMEFVDADGRGGTIQVIEDVRVNQGLPDDFFRFSAPKGAVVRDATDSTISEILQRQGRA